jgi:TatD DNase family protein
MIFIDSHTHLYLENFDEDRDTIIKNAFNNGIKYMLLPAIDKSTFSSMKALSNAYPENCFPMIGVHPTSVNENYLDELSLVESELKNGTYCAIGEIGIDLYWDKTFENQQKEAFRHQLRLSKKYNLPVAIHTRDSFDAVHKIVKEEQDGSLKGVFHCFTGNLQEAKKIIDLGFLMGIGGIVTFKNSGLDKIVKEIPLENILLETDSPFLTPAPFRGKRNESAYIKIIAEKIAEIKNTNINKIAEITTTNGKRLFNLDINNIN